MTENITPLKTPASNDSLEFELVPAGVYVARCYRMVDIGTHNVEFKGVAKPTRQIYLWWELLTNDKGEEVHMADGERVFSISRQYTWSMHKKANLRSDLNKWRGEPFTDDEASGFDLTKVLGSYCKLQVVHNVSGDRTYANVDGIMYTDPIDISVNPASSFSIVNPNMELFESFSDWLKGKIESAKEWGKTSEPEEKEGDITEDGKIEIENLDKPKGVNKSDLKKNPF